MYNSFVLCTRTTICSHLPVLQNSDSLLEGLVIDRDRTKISNSHHEWPCAVFQGNQGYARKLLREQGRAPQSYRIAGMLSMRSRSSDD